MSSDGVHWHDRAQRRVPEIDDLELALWGVVAVALVGDLVTTFVGLHLGLSESNPVARGAIEANGFAGMLLLKAFAVGVALCCRPLLEKPWTPVVPAALAAPWLVAVFVNLYVISMVL